MNFGALPEHLAHVRAEIARRQAIAGRTHAVTIVAVTKGFGLDAVAAALDAGLTDLGENRVQEALDKIDTPAGRRATWHLIGHLQRNKAKHVAGRFALVHSLDSVALAEERDALQEEGLWLPTLSMGMSADYGPAVEEGATVIRLGTVLFGPREPTP